MPADVVPYGRKTQRESAVKEVHVLWITAGLSCDGDSVSVTAAMQPSGADWRVTAAKITLADKSLDLRDCPPPPEEPVSDEEDDSASNSDSAGT